MTLNLVKLIAVLRHRSLTSIDDSETEHAGKQIHSRDFTKKESDNVNRLKFLVIFTLLVAAIAVGFTVYQTVSNSHKKEIATQYQGVATRVKDTFLSIPDDKIGPLGALRVAYISQARDTNTTWPFVALTSFQQRASIVQRLTQSLHVAIINIVQDRERTEWENFVATNNTWIKESLAFESTVGVESFSFDQNLGINISDDVTSFPITDPTGAQSGARKPIQQRDVYYPIWQSSPLLIGEVNMEVSTLSPFKEVPTVRKLGSVIMSDFLYIPLAIIDKIVDPYSGFLSNAAQKPVKYKGDALGHMYLPVFKSFNETDREVVAIMFALFQWSTNFKNILSEGEKGITVVLENGCNTQFTYKISGKDVTFLGVGDLHESKYNYMEETASFDNIRVLHDGTEFGLRFKYDYCPVSIRIYPSQEYFDSSGSNQAVTMTVIVSAVFFLTIIMFLIFDRLVEHRQTIVLNRAVQSLAVVSSLFPQAYADRLLEENCLTPASNGSSYVSNNKRLKSFLSTNDFNDSETPIADLFPFATVMFADIADFTAWSSSREPAQVFILLQKLYQKFDSLAKRRRVFKVETIGDSYVAVTGVPDPQSKHAVIMACFARDCQKAVVQVTAGLGLFLGPDTSDLRMRVGIHSGPVTAGILRGDRARFQLFGDTVNTAARMESTSRPTKIHISSATAALLINADKAHWVKPREDSVRVKGKGLLNTFWLVEGERSIINVYDEQSRCSEVQDEHDVLDDSQKKDLLVRWICELILVQMRNLVAVRSVGSGSKDTGNHILKATSSKPLDEVVEAIVLPDYKGFGGKVESRQIEIDEVVKEQLFNFIRIISLSYHDNPFHNFEHACHVTMSVNKLLMRIVTPDVDTDGVDDVNLHLYDYTHGISSDPITILGIIFSAVIHDLDHRGVSNVQLVKEEPEMGTKYHGKSVAEQNSLDIAWRIFLQKDFDNLRSFLFQTEDEFKRFRQVLVNVVLATDIFDKELNDLRKKRWEVAFAPVTNKTCHKHYQFLRATIVIEHVIQASDVAHTMQHWHVYRKWNNELFREMYNAYKSGRMNADPSEFWYEGELKFFDDYIIPLAKKLKDCCVFGVSSDEYLNYAEQNRAEWQARGKELVYQMVNELRCKETNMSHEPTLVDF